MSDDRIATLIENLRDFRTRSRAAADLVALGEGAADPLVRALDDEGLAPARWAIINALGELRTAAAVPVVARFLDQPDCQSVAHDALVRIVGKDLGPLPADWLRWADQRPVASGAAPTEHGSDFVVDERLTDERLLELAIDGTTARLEQNEPTSFTVYVPLGRGEAQSVRVIFGTQDHEGSPIVVVYCDCCRAKPDMYETVLRRNLRTPYGAVAIRDVGSEPWFVMFNAILRHALTPIELRKSVMAIAERAHRVHRQMGL